MKIRWIGLMAAIAEEKISKLEDITTTEISIFKKWTEHQWAMRQFQAP